MTKKHFRVGQEVIIRGPNILGEYTSQGGKGIVRGFCMDGYFIESKLTGNRSTYPKSSLVRGKIRK